MGLSWIKSLVDWGSLYHAARVLQNVEFPPVYAFDSDDDECDTPICSDVSDSSSEDE